MLIVNNTWGKQVQNTLYKFRVAAKKLWWFVLKYKYVFAVLLVVVLALGGWQYHKHQVDTAWKKATDFYSRADYASAAKELKSVSMPDEADKLKIYAQTMLATQQLDKAEEAYVKLYDVSKDPFAKLVLGNVYNQEKQYDKAVKVYEELISSNPNYTQAYVNLATVYKLQNKPKDAVSIAERGVKANPNDVTLNELLVSMAMDDTNSETYKTAVENLKKLNPNDPLLEALKNQ